MNKDIRPPNPMEITLLLSNYNAFAEMPDL